MPGYTNLPGIPAVFEDGNMSISAAAENPIVVVLGTADRGDATSIYDTPTVSQAVARFGRINGTLPRGLFETDAGGALSIKLLRIGAKSASLSSVGTGLSIETIDRDEKAGMDVVIFFDDGTGRLRVWRVSDNLLVYDNNPSYPHGAVDEYVVGVTGTWTTGAGDIGSLAVPITLEAADGVSGAVYTAGTDGIQLSRMELFEALYEAYELIENEEMDYVVPRDAYLDDLSVTDMTTAEVATLNTLPPWEGAPTTYPTRGTSFDALGEVFVQEYNGQNYFWWDMDRDGVAELYPSVGSASGSLDAYGNTLTASDFHEANFAYQLANFCYDTTEKEVAVQGVIGVRPPSSWAPKHVSQWIGKVPTYTEDSSGNLVITSSANNGSGLLGIKWMAGLKGSVATGLPGFTVDNLEGLAYGGFIATDSGWPDGSQESDSNDHLVDIGKYLIITGAYGILSNQSATTSYMANISSLYGGFVSVVPSNEAGTNKVLESVRLPFRIKNTKLDSLAGFRYTMLKATRKGIVVADAPTAARPDSDYQRQLTVVIVKAVVEALRQKADPFIGKGVLGGAKAVALETALDSALSSFVSSHLSRYEMALSYTRDQKIRGEATLKLLLVPVSELRELTLEISLSAV